MKKDNYLITIAIIFSGALIAGSLIYSTGLKATNSGTKNNDGNKIITISDADLENNVIPSSGVELPIRWNNLGKQLVDAGVINANQFEEIYKQREGLSDEYKKLLYGKDNGNIVITSQNSGFILNLFWALGLGNRNQILENGEMANPQYGGAQNFASTGGWTLAKGDTMNHYSKHEFIKLTASEQLMVEEVSKNIYRPCCGNSTHFPDCNHGMAMLGILELAASQGMSKEDMYKMALIINSYWFPQNYLIIAKYYNNRGINWDKVDAKEVLGINFSSAQGYQKILSQVSPPKVKSGGSCGV